MRRFASVVLAGSALALAATAPALARSPFDGVYTGAYVGYGNGDVKTTVGALADDKDLSGFDFGGYAGFGQSFDGFYLGVEGEVGYSTLDGDGTVGTVTTEFDTDWTYGLGLRAGYLVSRDVLAYGRVGYQWTGFEGSNTAGTTTVAFDENFGGWRFGGGVEVALTKNLLTRVEYSYTDYESFDPQVTVGGTMAALEPSAHSLRLGVAYKF